jgi:hypothetical protein
MGEAVSEVPQARLGEGVNYYELKREVVNDSWGLREKSYVYMCENGYLHFVQSMGIIHEGTTTHEDIIGTVRVDRYVETWQLKPGTYLVADVHLLKGWDGYVDYYALYVDEQGNARLEELIRGLEKGCDCAVRAFLRKICLGSSATS